MQPKYVACYTMNALPNVFEMPVQTASGYGITDRTKFTVLGTYLRDSAQAGLG